MTVSHTFCSYIILFPLFTEIRIYEVDLDHSIKLKYSWSLKHHFRHTSPKFNPELAEGLDRCYIWSHPCYAKYKKPDYNLYCSNSNPRFIWLIYKSFFLQSCSRWFDWVCEEIHPFFIFLSLSLSPSPPQAVNGADSFVFFNE